MPHRPVTRAVAALVAAALALLLTGGLTTAAAAPSAGAAVATTQQIESFDGTKITINWFPTPVGGQAPTVLYGPGWGGAGATNPADPTIAGLLAQGYNVSTWDPRGFGTSGGEAQTNSPDYEARDVSAIIDWVSAQPQAQLDGAGDPRLGMVGASYGGGVQLITAATDDRVDAIAPTIAWNSLVSSLYPDQTYKAGWAGILCALGSAGTNRVPEISRQACASGLTTGKITDEQNAWYAERGPADIIGDITAPTLILQGTVDTLFPLDESVANYRSLKDAGTPVKLVWFCGGHGQCLTNPGPAGYTERLTATWLAKYLRGAAVDTGPEFEWVDQNGTWHGADRYPTRLTGLMYGAGTGTLAVEPGQRSGIAIAALPAANALTVPLRAPRTNGAGLGAPRVTMTYKGSADVPKTVLYGQLVDRRTGVVLGNQVLPIPVTLDGRVHVVSRTLETVAHAVGPDSDIVLQLTDSTAVYDRQRSTGSVWIAGLVTVPLRS